MHLQQSKKNEPEIIKNQDRIKEKLAERLKAKFISI